jgi:3-hydroxyisobutyrate dehydrogenase-like beta-hydroxyacid dehydrogenase
MFIPEFWGMEKHENARKAITVIGLGQMGVRLAELLRDGGNPVIVWNRTIEKAQKIEGVQVVADIDSAIEQGSVIIICVYDYKAVNEVLASLKDKSFLAGKSIINLTTGSPDEATDLERWVKGNGGHYLDGAIQVAPEQMGLPDTTILISGGQDVFKQYEDQLRIFGGNIKYLGANASAASAMDLATLAWLYGSYVGLMHGAALVESTGLELSSFSDIITEITPGFTTFFKHELHTIATKDFTISQSPLAISIAATQRIHDAIKDNGIDGTFAGSIALLLKKADAAGLGGQELASLIKVIRKPGEM